MEIEEEFEAEGPGLLGEGDGVGGIVGEAAADGLDADAQSYPIISVVMEDLQAGLGDADVGEFHAGVLKLLEVGEVGAEGVIGVLLGAEGGGQKDGGGEQEGGEAVGGSEHGEQGVNGGMARV